jgi:hypothetical protein
MLAAPSRPSRRRHAALALVLPCLLAACSTAYYAAMEQLGWEPRDILINRVEVARDSQAAARTQFDQALRRMRALGNDDVDRAAGDAALRRACGDAAARARDLQKRVANVATAGATLFDALQGDNAAIKDPAARARAEQRTAQSRARYDRLLAAMQQASDATTPALSALQAPLAAAAPPPGAAVRAALPAAEAAVATLVGEIDHAIAEADAFVQQSIVAG